MSGVIQKLGVDWKDNPFQIKFQKSSTLLLLPK